MRSLRVRLAGLLLAIVAAAIGVVYLYVVPPLTDKLHDQEIQNVATVARRYAPELQRVVLEADQKRLDRLVDSTAERAFT